MCSLVDVLMMVDRCNMASEGYAALCCEYTIDFASKQKAKAVFSSTVHLRFDAFPFGTSMLTGHSRIHTAMG